MASIKIILLLCLISYTVSSLKFLEISSSMNDVNVDLLKEKIFITLVEMLNTEIKEFEDKLPSGANKLVSKMETAGRLVLERFDLTYFDQVMKEKELPEKAVEKFKGIIFSKNVVLNSFNLVITEQDAELVEMVGSANRLDKQVEMSFIIIKTKGNLLQQYNRVNERKCRTILFWETCEDNWISTPRGFTVEEINTINKTLRAEAFGRLCDNIKKSIYSFNAAWFNEELQKALQENAKDLNEKLQLAIQEMMNWAYQNKILPTINIINAMILRNRLYIDTIIADVIKNFKTSVNDVINNAIKKVNDLKDYIIDIKYTIEKAVESKMEVLNEKIKLDSYNIMNQIDKIKYSMDCFSTGLEVAIKNALGSNLSDNKPLTDLCIKELGQIYPSIKNGNISTYTNNSLYLVKKCINLKKAGNSETILGKIQSLQDALNSAAEMRCYSVMLNASSNIAFYVSEITEVSNKIEEIQK